MSEDTKALLCKKCGKEPYYMENKSIQSKSIICCTQIEREHHHSIPYSPSWEEVIAEWNKAQDETNEPK